MGTGESLTASERVQRLQTVLHAKAKEAPGFRFYSLSDKVWRDDVLTVAWQAVRRNGGAAGVDGVTVADIESSGVDRWLGALARDLKEGTYRPRAVRQVLIPKKQRGKFRPLGIPCLRDRVAQTAAMLVLSPIFEADLQPEQYAYRLGRHAHDAVRRVHRLLTTGHREVVDADLSDYYGQIPHADLLKSIARRVSDGRLLGWVKAWLEMAVEEDDGRGGRRRTNRARRERKGTPQGSGPITGSRTLRRVRRAFRGRRHDLVREPDAGNPHVRFDERRLETEPRRGVRHRHWQKPPGTATPSAYRHRASRRLYAPPANNPYDGGGGRMCRPAAIRCPSGRSSSPSPSAPRCCWRRC